MIFPPNLLLLRKIAYFISETQPYSVILSEIMYLKTQSL